ncbi:MAG: YdeI/OmpD-associated family protein [Saprospiraceae bacterium]
MSDAEEHRFESSLELSDNKLWSAHFAVPQWAVEALTDGEKDRRVVCLLNEKIQYQCALLPWGDGRYVISVNKKIQNSLKLKEGSRVEVLLKKDTSEFGLPMPEEFEELLNQEPEAKAYFDALTPGKKRTLLYAIAQPKRSEGRMIRALAVADHLVEQAGSIDFKLLNLKIKEYGKR